MALSENGNNQQGAQMTDSLYAKLRSYALDKKELIKHCTNEEQTRLSLINPYLELLGFDVRDPRKVLVEYPAGRAKGVERADYAILEDEEPVIIVEAKSATSNLGDGSPPSGQLKRYAHETGEGTVKFASITNGKEWRWYYMKTNGRLADSPFLVVDAFHPRETDASWLAKLSGGAKNRDTMDTAMGEHLTSQFTDWFEKCQDQPSDNLVKLVCEELGRKAEARSPKKREALKKYWIRACHQANQTLLRQARLEDAKRLGDKNPSESFQINAPPSETETSSRSCFVRLPNSKTQSLTDGTALQLWILEYCATHHRNGEDAYLMSISRPLAPNRSHKAIIGPNDDIDLEKRRRLYSGTDYKGYRVFNNLNNASKARFIQSLLSECTLRSGDSPKIGRDIEIELPNSSLSIRNITAS